MSQYDVTSDVTLHYWVKGVLCQLSPPEDILSFLWAIFMKEFIEKIVFVGGGNSSIIWGSVTKTFPPFTFSVTPIQTLNPY